MKEKTVEILKYDLNRNKIKEEKWEMNKDFIYEIEFLPVLTKRDKNGVLQEITNSDTRLLYMSEKGE
jgi:hypothetical protein